ncbi:hypothetical protein CPB83DRAFT_908461 [Crepidotus variabilis]|uniref:F-box domain-containing protein n=1 Tax=Crepidotus variabilis TaxID=179855 RepID=A0A9P6JN06_9AGAR|nr:hypothetical protein CPB83DRAFT_908461 [Crepidotus variabilis]
MTFEYVEAFPLELWQECLQSVDKPDLHALSLSSRRLREISFPLLMKNISFVIPSPELSGSSPEDADISPLILEKRIFEKLEAIEQRFAAISNSEQRTHVQKLNFWAKTKDMISAGNVQQVALSAEGETKYSATCKQIQESISDALCRFRRLRQLHIGFIQFPNRFFQAAADLPYLEHLSLFEVDLSHLELDRLLDPLTFHVSGHFSRINPSLSTVKHIFCPRNLRDLRISDSNTILVLNSFVHQSIVCSNLVKIFLFATPAECNVLVDFLKLCPSLKTLQLDDSFHDPFSSYNRWAGFIPGVAAPRLSSFNGPESFAAALSPNRPITSMNLGRKNPQVRQNASDQDFSFDLLASLSLGCVPITSLDFGMRVVSKIGFAAITEIFPKLRSLKIHVLHPMHQGVTNDLSYLALMTLLEANELPLPKTLRSLQLIQGDIIDFSNPPSRAEVYPAEMQQRLLRKLSINNPELLNAIFGVLPTKWERKVDENDNYDWAEPYKDAEYLRLETLMKQFLNR